jgi:hypothetical protein
MCMTKTAGICITITAMTMGHTGMIMGMTTATITVTTMGIITATAITVTTMITIMGITIRPIRMPIIRWVQNR